MVDIWLFSPESLASEFVGASITLERKSEEALRNSASPRPNDRAISGSLLGPNIKRATTKITSSSGRPIPNTGNLLTLEVNLAWFRVLWFPNSLDLDL